jgi:hypothetical protein
MRARARRLVVRRVLSRSQRDRKMRGSAPIAAVPFRWNMRRERGRKYEGRPMDSSSGALSPLTPCDKDGSR